MTREERLELLKLIEKDIHVCSIESTFLDDAKSCAIHSVIEELEQEPIIDKIRAEIAELSHYYPMGHDYQIAITRCIAVIDKFKEAADEPEQTEE